MFYLFNMYLVKFHYKFAQNVKMSLFSNDPFCDKISYKGLVRVKMSEFT